MCGTPVLALDYGSVPEALEDGVTGFIGNTEEDLVRAVLRLPDLSRAACRRVAETRFCAGAMTDSYERVYAALLERRTLPRK